MLAAGGVFMFLFSGKWRDVEHADRLALLPIEEERTRPHDDRADLAPVPTTLRQSEPAAQTTPSH
jgi:hypothetical protein